MVEPAQHAVCGGKRVVGEVGECESAVAFAQCLCHRLFAVHEREFVELEPEE